ncbi:YjgN family protein [Noviherbaspirillum aridicola]|nr:YjgN family protein [Noviherbaspirillum aridicola]
MELALEPEVPARAAPAASLAPAPLRSRTTAPAPADDEPVRMPFEFTGSGSEYFRIWVVNLLLTLLTLGVYSAWAKVRRLQYFYRNTRLDGAVFDFHGSPKAILRGRILALLLVAAYKISFDISAVAAVAVALLLAAITPWLLARAFRFKLANTSYRGIRFRFRGSARQAYARLILFPAMLALTGLFVWSLVASFRANPGVGVILLAGILPIVALGATVPLAHYALKRYQHEQADYGQTAFYYHGRVRGFFAVYGKALGLVFLGGIPAAIFGMLTARLSSWLMATMFGWLFALLYGLASAYAFYLFVRPYLEARLQNLVWNDTEVGMHRFESRASARHLLWIHASNLMLITLTLGLYKPFATVRLVRYRVASMALVAVGGLEDLRADHGADDAGAAGQEAGDLFDIDIGL